MQFWEKYRPVFEASNDVGSAPADPPASEALAPDPAPPTETQAAPETPTEAVAETAPAPKTNETPWYLRELAKERGKRQEEAEARASAERRAAEAEALAQRLQTQRQGDAPPVTPSTPRPTSPNIDQDLIRQEAARMRLYEDALDVRNRGLAEYGAAFNETLNIINSLGASTDDFVSDVLAVDKVNAHTLYKKLGEEPEKLAALTQMSSRQRIAELTRLSMAKAETKASEQVSAPPVKQVSKAPPPPPPVSSSASKVTDWRSDKASDAEFTRGWEETMRLRAEKRRGLTLR
jgi:hypothetical protein